MTVRLAAPADVRAIAEIHVSAWRAAYRGLIPDAYLDALTVEKRVELWRNQLAKADAVTLIVAQERDRLAGFCLFGPTRDQDGKGRPVGEIIALNVGPEHWRHGYGRALCEFALHEAPRRGWTALTLWILKGNERAMRFYETLDFALDGTERLDEHVIGSPIYELRYRKAL